MNPFDWAGPEFLLFYAAFSGMVALAVNLALNRSSSLTAAPGFKLADPYAIAFLRGQERHTVCVALLSLIVRDLVQFADGAFSFTDRGRACADPQGLDGKILRILTEAPSDSIEAIAKAPAVQHELDKLRGTLQNMGVIETARSRARRGRIRWLAVASLWGVAALKICLALSRGRTNVEFLIAFAIVSSWLINWHARPRSSGRSRAGSLLLAGLEVIYADLLRRVKTLQLGDVDVVLVAAVYGLQRLPRETFPFANLLLAVPLPLPSSSSSRADSGWFGDTCSTGSGCGGGGGDGGSGCGGCGGH